MAAYRRVYDSRHLQAEGCYQLWCLVNRGTMGVNSLPKTVTRQNSGCDLNPGVSAPESSTVANHSATEPSWWGRGANVRYLSNAPAAVYLSIRVINSPIERLVDPMPKTGTTTGLVEEADCSTDWLAFTGRN